MVPHGCMPLSWTPGDGHWPKKVLPPNPRPHLGWAEPIQVFHRNGIRKHRSTLAEVQREVEMRLPLQVSSPSRLCKTQICFLP